MLSRCPLFHKCSVHPGSSSRAGPQCLHGSRSECQHPPSLFRALCQQTNSSSKGFVESKTFEPSSFSSEEFCHVPSAKQSHPTIGSISLFCFLLTQCEPKGIILGISLQASSLSGRVYLGNWKVLKIAFHLFQRTLKQDLVQPRLASDSLVAEAGLKTSHPPHLYFQDLCIYIL